MKTPKPKRPYIDNPTFHAPDAVATLFPPDYTPPKLPPVYLLGHDNGRNRVPPLKAIQPDEERRLFLQYNFARYRVAQGGGGERAVWAARAAHLEDYITRRNLPLVSYTYGHQRLRLTQFDLDTLSSEGMAALLRCVRAFDIGRGWKFSTMAFTVIKNSFTALMIKSRSPRRGGGAMRSSLEHADAVVTLSEYRDVETKEAAAYLGELLETNVAELNPRQQEVLTMRYGLGGGERMTLDGVSHVMGVTRERVRQIQMRALLKLRETISPLVLVK